MDLRFSAELRARRDDIAAAVRRSRSHDGARRKRSVRGTIADIADGASTLLAAFARSVRGTQRA